MKLFNYIIQHKNDYIDDLIVDSEYTMTEEDEKDYKVIGEESYTQNDVTHRIKVYHSINRYSSGPFTLVDSEEEESTGFVTAKLLNHHSLKDIINWQKTKTKHLHSYK